MLLWNDKKLRPALWFLGFLAFTAVARDILANGRPLYCRIAGISYFPGLRSVWTDPNQPYHARVLDSLQQNFSWRRHRYEFAVFAPIPFSPGELPMTPDITAIKAPPGAIHPGPVPRFRHWLGTDKTGYDVAAGLVGGARVAILTGGIAMCLAFGIGIPLGAIAGFWGDNRLRIVRRKLISVLCGIPFAWFYAFAFLKNSVDAEISALRFVVAVALFSGILALFYFLGNLLLRTDFFKKPVLIPADLLIMRLAEVFNALPALLVIVAFAAVLQAQTQTIWPMIALIGAFSWPGVALFVRSELLRIRELDYVLAARGIGLSEWRVLYRHALPNALRPALTAFAFGVGAAILLETGLSFLGYGGSNLQGATWGSLLQNARTNPELWWICLPPGLAVCLTILALNAIGEALSERR